MKNPINKKKNQAALKAKENEIADKNSAQEWLPFNDVFGGFINRRDNHLSAVGRIHPLNIALKSDREKAKVITGLHEAYNPQREVIHMYTIPRPVDLDSYLDSQQTKASETKNLLRKRLLNEYIRYVAGIVRGGEAMERRYYNVMSQPPGKNQKDNLYHNIHDLNNRMSDAGLDVEVIEDTEILDMLFSFLQPGRAAFEPSPDGSANFVTMYKGGLTNDE